MLPFFAKVELPNISQTQDLGQFISDVYAFAITIVGVLVFVVFLWAGWLYLTAAGNAGNVSKAKTMMTNAIVGAIILLSAYLILYVINPDLVENTFNFKLPAATSGANSADQSAGALKLISLDPTSDVPGADVTALAENVTDDAEVLWDGEAVESGKTGSNQVQFQVPDTAPPGSHRITLRSSGQTSNALTFQVLPAD